MPTPFVATCNIFDCKLFEKEIRYYLVPDEKNEQLKQDMDNLKKEKQRVEKDANYQLRCQPTKRCKGKVESWMLEVDTLEKKVTELLESPPPRDCCLKQWFSCLFWVNRERRISQMVRQVEMLKLEGNNLNGELVEEASPARTERIAGTASEVVGMDNALEELLAHLQNPRTYVIGIYGGAGIGKTTLITELNNYLLQQPTLDFDFIIWVNVFQSADTEKIQRQISKRLWPTTSDNLPNDLVERASFLFKFFSCGMKFLFLMDDVWKELKLKEIGIPPPNDKNNIKIIFTTRLKQVCNEMCAQASVKMECLDLEKSLELFLMNLGDNTKLSENYIKQYAERMVEKCDGLPLALITVAKAVRGYDKGGDWEYALSILRESLTEIEGVEENLLRILNFSFVNLRDGSLQSCLLHCALYPEDEDICEEDIVYHWIAEGLLDDAKGHRDDFANARAKGFKLISKLKKASLLEDSIRGDFYFKMHNCVRSMCLWIADGKHDKDSDFEVKTIHNNDGSAEMRPERWETVTKVSLMQSEIESFRNHTPECPKLVTLLLTDCHMLKEIHHEFFKFMTALRVLDLRDTKLDVVPRSISCLLELRFLDLRGTAIKCLPEELGYLTKLKQLHLSSVKSLEHIPKKAVSPLKKLEHLCTEKTPYRWGQTEAKDLLQLEDFKDFNRLSELGLDITSNAALDYLISSPEICRKVKYIVLHGSDFDTDHVIRAYKNLPHVTDFTIKGNTSVNHLTLNGRHHLIYLAKLHLENNKSLRCVTTTEDKGKCAIIDASQQSQGSLFPFSSLRCIIINGCLLIKDLDFVRQLPILEELHVIDCSGLEEIVHKVNQNMESAKDTFFNTLQVLQLRNLQNLRSICSLPLEFRSLRSSQILLCPQLHKLPFGLNSAKNIKKITGSQDWWNNLKWDDNAIRSKLQRHFQPVFFETKLDAQIDERTHDQDVRIKFGLPK